MVIRPIQHQDLHVLRAIARESGPGFTSLVDDPHVLKRKIAHSVASFDRAAAAPAGEHYLFILEDDDTGQVMGTTGIEASAGHERPLFHFRCTAAQSRPDQTRASDWLTRCNHYTGCSEICSLYLRPAYRGAGHRKAHAGRLLSKVRFLFMAQHPLRFAQTVIAEMRGVSDAQGQSPFWDSLKSHAGNLDFATVTQLAGMGNSALLNTLLPEEPIATASLSERAREVIGQVHEQTRPALKLLLEEGFRHTGFVDLFDAGPTVEAPRGDIASVRQSAPCQVQVVDDNVLTITRNQQALLLANTGISDFRATVTKAATWLPHRQVLAIPRSLAARLKLETGSPARFLPLAQATGRGIADAGPTTTEARYAY
ncbi:arginine N-succinyltransferase [Marinobacter sp.]|uniref:arginine N-succinyltransferase n=1 Tax=Marinobacter sp. TaxID=50741 RepID=UPI0034A127D1